MGDTGGTGGRLITEKAVQIFSRIYPLGLAQSLFGSSRSPSFSISKTFDWRVSNDKPSGIAWTVLSTFYERAFDEERMGYDQTGSYRVRK